MYLIVSLLIRSRLNSPSIKKTTFGVLISKVKAALYKQKRGHIKTIATDIGNYSSPFLIARLNSLAFSILIGPRNNYIRANYTHYKASLIKVIEISVKDAIFSPYIKC